MYLKDDFKIKSLHSLFTMYSLSYILNKQDLLEIIINI